MNRIWRCFLPLSSNKVTTAEAMILGARWDREMDELLREGVLRYGAEWEDVSTHMTPHECPKEEVEKRYTSTCLG